MTDEQVEKQINAEGGQMAIVFSVPTNTVKLEVIATVIDENNELDQVTRTINLPEIFEARILGDDWEWENAHYSLTEKGIQAKEQI